MIIREMLLKYRTELQEEIKILEEKIKDRRDRIKAIDLVCGLLCDEYFAQEKIKEKDRKRKLKRPL